MGFFSLMPEWGYLSTLETWLVRIFLLLALLTVGPWVLVLVYDALLYIWRSATYEIPAFGGRASGRARPRAPSLAERPSGHKRQFSLASIPRLQPEQPEDEAATSGSKPAPSENVPRMSYEATGE